MTRSELMSRQTIRIQQLLFGYDRGHTLLAASSSTAKKRATAILSDTDWDPRTVSGTESYLSGRPLAGEKCYALMKTWRAPEMPRPGCVWTHVLLIDEADLSRVSRLECLEEVLKRPRAIGKYQTYLSDLDLDIAKTQKVDIELDPHIVSDLVRLVYMGVYSPKALSNPIPVERGMLALWSQQWPALRRGLSFRTAPLATKKSASKSNFDIELSDFKSALNRHIDVSVEDTLRMIKGDICGNLQSDLRRFLWRYGADTDGHRDNLIRLAHLYRELDAATPTNIDVAAIIDQIEDWYPQPKEAHLFKTDIARSTESEFSLVPELDQFEVVRALRSRSTLEAFPELVPVDSKTVNSWIKQRPSEMLSLLGATAQRKDPFAVSLFDGVSTKKNAEFVWELLAESETAFLRVSKGSLAHLVDKRIHGIGDESLLALVKETKERTPILESLVPYLLMRDNTQLITLVNDEVSQSVTTAVIDQLARVAKSGEPAVNSNWVECIKDHSDQITRFAKETADRRSQLLVCRYLLNADTNRYPLAVWSKRLDILENDLAGSADLEFRVFLLIQALHHPEKGADVLIADTFDSVYQALGGSQLPFRTEMQLADYLPHIGWFNNWDKCLRLKIAIVRVCKNLSMSRKATLAITNDAGLRDELIEIWNG